MKRTITLLAFLFSFVALLQSQEYLAVHQNQVDQQGRRQGKWKVYDEAGILKFIGQFKDDIPYGEFTYYYPGGQVKAISKIFNGGQSSYTKSYHKNGFPMAEGKFMNRLKDSVWNYYSEYDANLLVAVEYYDNNKKQGVWQSYYPDGQVAEEFTYVNDLRDGSWIQYFSDGKIKLKATYRKGKLNGLITIYHPNGEVNISGNYSNGLKNGVWMVFNEKAETLRREEYYNGHIVDKQIYMEEGLIE